MYTGHEKTFKKKSLETSSLGMYKHVLVNHGRCGPKNMFSIITKWLLPKNDDLTSTTYLPVMTIHIN